MTRALDREGGVLRHGIPVLGRPERIVPRTVLLERIRADPSPIVVVEGAAGSGKSTLLAEWARTDTRPSTWLTISNRHSDPVVLVRALTQSLASVHPHGPLATALRHARGSDVLRGLARLTRALDAEPEPTLLVVDDVHELSEQAALDVLAILADRFPDTGRIAFATRAEPAMPIPRWRLTGRVLVIDRTSLEFDAQECALLLERLGVRDAESLAPVVRHRTEGWVAGIALMGLSFAQRPDGPKAEVEAGAVADAEAYVRTELLDQLHPSTRETLVRTAHLEVVTGPLADAVCDAPGSERRLADVAARGLLVTSLDAGASYRYHALLRAALAAELARDPATELEVRMRTAAWYQAAGMPSEAIEQSLGAGDLDRAAALILEAAQTLYRLGEVASLKHWIGSFEDTALRERPGLVSLAAYVFALEGDAPGATRWAEVMTAPGSRAGARARASDERGPGVDFVSAMLCARGPEVMLEDALRALDRHGQEWSWRSNALFAAAMACLMLRRPTLAAERLGEVERTPGIDAALVRLPVRAERAIAEAAQRRWGSVQRILDLDRRAVLDDPESGLIAGLPWLVADARLATHHGDLQGANDRLQRVQVGRVRLSWAMPWYSVRTLTELARVQLLVGDHPGARVTLSQARDTVAMRPLLGMLIDELELVSQQALAAPRGDGSWSTLTRAELRLLPLLQTYLTIKEIGERLGVSPNTAKTQALSIYGKLGASTRSEAVEAAVARGLLEDVLAGRT